MRTKRIIVVLIWIAGFLLLGVSNSFSAEVFGCPKDEIVMLTPRACPVCGSSLSIVNEGYISDKDKVLLDTFSKEEKQELGIEEDRKFFIIVYESPSGERNFLRGGDSQGQALKRKVVELKYRRKDAKSLEEEMLASRQISQDWEILGDTPQSIREEEEEKLKSLEQSKRKQMARDLEESWPFFYKQEAAYGLSEGEIEAAWEIQKFNIYEKYNYDPQSDSFMDLEMPAKEAVNEESHLPAN